MLLTLISEDESEAFNVCCGGLHAYLGAFVFTLFDSVFGIATCYVYLQYVLTATSWTNVIPFVVVMASILSFPIGPYGLINEDARTLRIYLWRLRLIYTFSMVWMCVCLFVQDAAVGIVVSIVWLISTVLYVLGAGFFSTAIDFLNDYRGYDGADLEMLQKHLHETLKVSDV